MNKAEIDNKYRELIQLSSNCDSAIADFAFKLGNDLQAAYTIKEISSDEAYKTQEAVYLVLNDFKNNCSCKQKKLNR